MNKWISIGISALSDFFITAGTAYLAIGSGTSLPATAQIVACIVGGLVAGARGVQKLLTPPPQ